MSRCEAEIKIVVGDKISIATVRCQLSELSQEGFWKAGTDSAVISELEDLSVKSLQRVCAKRMEDQVVFPKPQITKTAKG